MEESTADREFGAHIRRLRKQLGISQKELADRASIHRGYLSQLESGLRSPSLSVIAALADGLGVQAWELVRSVEDALGLVAPAMDGGSDPMPEL